MDRASLELFLSQRLSLEQIGKRVGRHPSTVGYWVKKHGLEAVNRERHAARGGLEKHELERLIRECGSIRSIADTLGLSEGSVKYWLGKFDLRTEGGRGRRRSIEAREARAAGLAITRMTCRHHGETDFWLEGRGYYRCRKCRWEAVVRRRRKVKAILVAEMGGACRICGYDRYQGALQFHHLEPSSKRFSPGSLSATLALARVREEASKCVLLCANCHAEVEAGIVGID